MSTSVKFFHSEMPGAPVLSGTAGALAAVLDACLVNGWGLLTAQSATVSGGVCTLTFSTTHAFERRAVALVAGAGAAGVNGEQRIESTATNSISFPVSGVADGPVAGTITAKLAPAGWQKYAGANKASYKSTSPEASGCWARIDDTGANVARLRAYESMTDVDTGTGPTPIDGQLSGGLYVAKSNQAGSASRRWIVAASDKSVLMMIAYYGSYSWDYAPYFFGDFESLKAGDAYNFAVSGDTSDSSTQNYVATSSALVQSWNSSGTFIVRSYTQAGGSVAATVNKPGMPGSSSGSTNNPPGPNPINNSLEVTPTLIYEGIVNTAPRRGVIPGIYGIPHYVGASYDSKQEIVGVDGLPGNVLWGVRYMSASGGHRYAVDITGPWE